MSAVNVRFSWKPVSIADSDTPRYTLEYTYQAGIYTQTKSVDSLASNYTTRFPGSNAQVKWRVKAYDPVHPTAQTSFTPTSTFSLEYPPEGMAPVAAPRTLFSALPITPAVQPQAIQVASAEPGAPDRAYSVDTDAISIEVRRGDRPASLVGPAVGWSSSGTELLKPSPFAAGDPDPSSVLASAPADGQFWTTDLATRDRDWNWQMARFDLDPSALANAQDLALAWTGHGEPTAGYRTTLYLWDFTTGSWAQVSDNTALGDTTTLVARMDQSRTTAFCLRCHDGTMPAGVQAPKPLPNIATAWSSTGADAHGDRASVSFGAGGLVTGYSRGSTGLDCTVCHDAHGSKNIYHFNDVMNGATPVTVTDGRSARELCYSCHTGSVAVWHKACADCHNGLLADPQHSSAVTVVTPDENSDCLSCHQHGRVWEHKECLSCHGVQELNLLGAPGSAHTETFNLF
jgi:hypothetical protein